MPPNTGKFDPEAHLGVVVGRACDYTTCLLQPFLELVSEELGSSFWVVSGRTISTEQIAAFDESFPTARVGRPAEVAEMAAYPLSDGACGAAGAALHINGGDLMV